MRAQEHESSMRVGEGGGSIAVQNPSCDCDPVSIYGGTQEFITGRSRRLHREENYEQGAHALMLKQVEGLRQRLVVSLALYPEPFSIPRSLKLQTLNSTSKHFRLAPRNLRTSNPATYALWYHNVKGALTST